MNKIVEIKFTGGKKIEAEIDGMAVRTDQSREHGGEGSAPEPFSLFLASIATCAGIYALEFCAARDIPPEGMGLRMECESDPEAKRYTRMTLELTLPREFPEKLRPAIARAMDLCAVKRHLLAPPEFRILTTPDGERGTTR